MINQDKIGENEEDYDQMEVNTYECEKLTSPIAEIFSIYGERRWICILPTKDEKNREIWSQITYILKMMNWKRMINDYTFAAPPPIDLGEETRQVDKLLALLKEQDLLDQNVCKFEIVCGLGEIQYRWYKPNK